MGVFFSFLLGFPKFQWSTCPKGWRPSVHWQWVRLSCSGKILLRMSTQIFLLTCSSDKTKTIQSQTFAEIIFTYSHHRHHPFVAAESCCKCFVWILKISNYICPLCKAGEKDLYKIFASAKNCAFKIIFKNRFSTYLSCSETIKLLQSWKADKSYDLWPSSYYNWEKQSLDLSCKQTKGGEHWTGFTSSIHMEPRHCGTLK